MRPIVGTENEKPMEQLALDAQTAAAARAIQLDAGTPSAVEFLKARDVEGSVIEQVLNKELPEGLPPALD
jgi:hypothetical protein